MNGEHSSEVQDSPKIESGSDEFKMDLDDDSQEVCYGFEPPNQLKSLLPSGMSSLDDKTDEDEKPSIKTEYPESNNIYKYKSRWHGRGRCEWCEGALTSRRQAKRHMIYRHARQTMFQCVYCEFRVRQRNLLNRHVATLHNRDELEEIAIPTSKQSLHEILSSKKLMKCRYCMFETFSNQIRSHILTVHRVKSNFHKCRYCTFSTDKLIDLADHQSAHDSLRIYSCPRCDYKTVRWTYLYRHFKFDHAEIFREIDLLKEKKKYSSVSSDPDTFKDVSDSVFVCDQCNVTCSNQKSLSRHILRNHMKNWTVMKLEQKSTVEDVKTIHEDSNNSSDLQSESSQPSTDKPKKFYCPKCDFVTLYESLYHEHLACNHMKVQNVQYFHCEYCSFSSVYSHSVKRHYNTVHIKIRTKPHDYIPKEKTFECDFCAVIYKKKFLLRRHIVRDHDEDRPYNCTICDYKAATRPEVARHMRLHV